MRTCRFILCIAHPLSVTAMDSLNLIGYFEYISQSDFRDLFLLLTTDAQSTIVTNRFMHGM